ncbi:Rrf2 family transcriptional regulator [Phormidium tenue FACHB-886]|nr:Rrf2 family transcriptional regulator [Phormidium tenue FACHB-886]
MELSSRLEYALAALLELACHPDQTAPVRVKSIADKQGIPDRYLEHIFITLRRAGLVYSQRGIRGGYFLARKPQQITLLEVLECLDDSNGMQEASSSLSLNRSVVRDAWKDVHQTTKALLQQVTLQDLYLHRVNREQLSGLMYYI